MQDIANQSTTGQNAASGPPSFVVEDSRKKEPEPLVESKPPVAPDRSGEGAGGVLVKTVIYDRKNRTVTTLRPGDGRQLCGGKLLCEVCHFNPCQCPKVDYLDARKSEWVANAEEFEVWLATLQLPGANPLPLWVCEKMKTAWDASAERVPK